MTNVETKAMAQKVVAEPEDGDKVWLEIKKLPIWSFAFSIFLEMF